MKINHIFIATILIGLFLPTAAFAVGNFDDEGGSMSFDTGVPQYQDSLIVYCDLATSVCLDASGNAISTAGKTANLISTSSPYTILSYSLEASPSSFLRFTCGSRDLTFNLFAGKTESTDSSLWTDYSDIYSGIFPSNPFFIYRNDAPIHCSSSLVMSDSATSSYAWVQYVPYDTRAQM